MLVVSFWGKYLHIHHLELIVITYLSFHMSILKTNGRLSSFYHTYIISSPNIHKCDSRNTSATIMLHFTLQWINMCQNHCTCTIKNFLHNNSTTSKAINKHYAFRNNRTNILCEKQLFWAIQTYTHTLFSSIQFSPLSFLNV